MFYDVIVFGFVRIYFEPVKFMQIIIWCWIHLWHFKLELFFLILSKFCLIFFLFYGGDVELQLKWYFLCCQRTGKKRSQSNLCRSLNYDWVDKAKITVVPFLLIIISNLSEYKSKIRQSVQDSNLLFNLIDSAHNL